MDNDFLKNDKMIKSIHNNNVIFIISIILVTFFAVKKCYSSELNINDQAITAAVKNELLIDAGRHINFSSLGVHTKNKIVTLTGNSKDMLSKEKAAKIAGTVKGVQSVINRMEVLPVNDLTDQDIHHNIEKALLRDPSTDLYEIDVNVNNYIVTLNGIVDSWQEKLLVESTVKEIRGVKGINNRVRVAYKKERPDKEIEYEIKGILKMDVLVNDGLIKISVDDGKVNIYGAVGSLAEKSRVFNASFIAGVKSVDTSNLVIQEWLRDEDLKADMGKKLSDNEIKDAIKRSLLYDPRVSISNLNIKVKSGIVKLQGSVSNLRAKKAAIRDCFNTVGVVNVKDYLTIKKVKKRKDENIKNEIIDTLNNHAQLYDQNIKVIVKKGTVYMSGNVDSVYDKAKAEDVISNIMGVSSINNNLKVLKLQRK